MEATIRRWVKSLIIFAVLLGLLYFLIAIGDLVKLMIISAILAYVLDPLVTMIEANGLNRTPATAILFSAMMIVFAAIMILLLPVVSSEIISISRSIDPEKAQAAFVQLESFLAGFTAFIGVPDLNLTTTLVDMVVQYGNDIFGNLLSVVSLFTNLVLIPFIAFFLLKDGRTIKKYLVSLVPNRYFELTCNLLYKMDIQLGNYLRGQVIDASIIGLLSILALSLLQVQNAILIGTVAGIANVIPYIGPICGAVIAIVLSLLETGDMGLVLYIAIAFIIVQLLDNVVVQPTVVAKNVNLPPLLVLLVVIIGGKFFGILGMLLSVPLTAVLKVFLVEGYTTYKQYNFS